MCAVIPFLQAKNMNAVETHRELCAVYDQNVMSEWTLRQWCRMFKDGRKNVHDVERSGQPAIFMNDGLAQSVDQKICERWRFTISEVLCEFPEISRTLLYEIIRVRLSYNK
jgi:hypothetical protein